MAQASWRGSTQIWRYAMATPFHATAAAAFAPAFAAVLPHLAHSPCLLRIRASVVASNGPGLPASVSMQWEHLPYDEVCVVELPFSLAVGSHISVMARHSVEVLNLVMKNNLFRAREILRWTKGTGRMRLQWRESFTCPSLHFSSDAHQVIDVLPIQKCVQALQLVRGQKVTCILQVNFVGDDHGSTEVEPPC